MKCEDSSKGGEIESLDCIIDNTSQRWVPPVGLQETIVRYCFSDIRAIIFFQMGGYKKLGVIEFFLEK